MALFGRKPPRSQRPAGSLVDNTVVQEALRVWGGRKAADTMAGVLRQCCAGELLLDASTSTITDRAHPFAQGDTLAVASVVDNAGKRLLLAFTSNDRIALRAGTTDTLSLAQPALGAVQMAIDRYDGIAIDAGHPDSCIVYRDELIANLGDEPEQNVELKEALLAAAPRGRVLELLARNPRVFIAAGEQRDADGRVVAVTASKVWSGSGQGYPVLCTSPAEVWAFAPGDAAQATGVQNIARVALEDGEPGVVVNPAGEGLVLTLDDLRGLLDRIERTA